MTTSPSEQALPQTPSSMELGKFNSKHDLVSHDEFEMDFSKLKHDHQLVEEVVDYFDHKFSKLWSINLGLISFFSILYFLGYIVATFYLNPYTEWHDITHLPDLGASFSRAFTIATHITCGYITMFVGLFQISKSFRHKFLYLHKIMGRIYVFCVILTCLGGICFVIFNNFETIGGIPTTLASFTYGIYWLGITLTAVYYIKVKKDINQHKRWMLRSYMLSIASIMYRIWYIMVAMFGYMIPRAQYSEEHKCYNDGRCEDYLRVFDQFNGWWFFVGNSLFIEYVLQSKNIKWFKQNPKIRRCTLDFLAIFMLALFLGTNFLLLIILDVTQIGI